MVFISPVAHREVMRGVVVTQNIHILYTFIYVKDPWASESKQMQH